MTKNFTCNHTKIYYKLEGQGTPVVLLHGFAENNHIWDEQISFLQAHCLVIAPDLPGAAKSRMPKKNDPVTVDDFAAMIYELLLHERVKSCIIIGHSMGGYITYAFAGAYPGMLKAFGVVHSTAFADNEDKKAGRRKNIETIQQYGTLAFLKASIPGLFAESFQKKHPEKVQHLIETGKTFSATVLEQYTIAMMNRPDRTEVLTSSEVPVLFILGTDDVAAPANDVLQQVHLPRVSYIHILKDVGHMGMLEAPEVLNNHLLDFIRACEPE